MNTQNKQLQSAKGQRGFTIIEVVLVLAIAGLIFLMVFLALPALQKGQRDTQRREDLSRISTQINSYSSNARGKIPTSDSLGTFVSKYLGDGATSSQAGIEYSDPSGAAESEGADPEKGYIVRYAADSDRLGSGTGVIYYTAGVTCNDDDPGSVVAGKARNYALRTNLENQSAAYCIDNR